MPQNLLDLVSRSHPVVCGAFMAVILSLLRIFYDREEKKPLRILLECALCGFLSLTVSSGIIALSVSPDWAVFAGGAVGYLGPSAVKALAIKIFERKVL